MTVAYGDVLEDWFTGPPSKSFLFPKENQTFPLNPRGVLAVPFNLCNLLWGILDIGRWPALLSLDDQIVKEINLAAQELCNFAPHCEDPLPYQGLFKGEQPLPKITD